MSFVKSNINEYSGLIKSKISDKELELKLKEYDSLAQQLNKIMTSALQENHSQKSTGTGYTTINGSLKQVSASGKDYIWGVNESDTIWTCKKPCTNPPNWVNVGGRLSQVDADDTEVWGVNANDYIYKKNVNNSNGWKNIPGRLINVTASGKDYIWGANRNNNVYKCKKPCNGEWKLDEGVLKQVSGSSDKIWGIKSNGTIWYKNIDGTGSWSVLQNGRAKWISATNKDKLFVVGTDDRLYSCDQPCEQPGKWQLIGGQDRLRFNNVSGNTDSENSKIDWWAIDNNQIISHQPAIDAGGWRTEKNMFYKPKNAVSKDDRTYSDSLKFFGKRANGEECKEAVVSDTFRHDVKMEKIYIGNSDKNSKEVTLPEENMIVSPNPANFQDDSWPDTFSIEVKGNKLTVSRTDATGGWGQPLELNATSTKGDGKVNVYEKVIYNEKTENCYGVLEGADLEPTYNADVTTYTAPGNSTLLGGRKTKELIERLNQVNKDIEKIMNEKKQYTIGVEKTGKKYLSDKKENSKKLDGLIEKLRKDRLKINKLMKENNDVGGEENTSIQNTASWYKFLIFLVGTIIMCYLTFSIISTEGSNVSPFIMTAAIIALYLAIPYYWRQIKYYGFDRLRTWFSNINLAFLP
jgi:hypothetical protein